VTAHSPLYDSIGRSYSKTRREDPRIAAEIRSCLGGSRSVVNVGAGTGNYEPSDRLVVAVEPSPAMLRQRRGRTRRVVRAVAEALPFPDTAFDAAMAVLTIHHWAEPEAGLGELRRIARRQIVFFSGNPSGSSVAADTDVWRRAISAAKPTMATDERRSVPA
jgi:SAM-dependent methyltransferase